MTALSYPFDTGAGRGIPNRQSWSDMLRGFSRAGGALVARNTVDGRRGLLARIRARVLGDPTTAA